MVRVRGEKFRKYFIKNPNLKRTIQEQSFDKKPLDVRIYVLVCVIIC